MTNTAANPSELFTVGGFQKVFDMGADEGGSPWHLNDHCFFRANDSDSTWHMFGITYPDPGYPVPAEIGLAHATASALTQYPWIRQPYALMRERQLGETVLWAPHIVAHAGLHYMFYCSGGEDLTNWGISLATSPDLLSWTRHPAPLFHDGFQARDPMVMWNGFERRWVIYYCATDDPAGGHHTVAYRTSPDLLDWSPRGIAYVDRHTGTEYGPTESPFVLRRGGYFYLLIGPRPYDPPTAEQPNWEHVGYDGTDVFRSRDWRHWSDSDYVGHIPAHAAEIVRDIDGAWYVSHAGIKRGGLYLAPLWWKDGVDEADTSLSAL